MTIHQLEDKLRQREGIHSYVQSIETYSGFQLAVVMERFMSQRSLQYHRSCYIFKDDECIGIDKTKKSAKDLIDHECFKEVKR